MYDVIFYETVVLKWVVFFSTVPEAKKKSLFIDFLWKNITKDKMENMTESYR